MSDILNEPLAFVGTTDLAGILRGKAFPTSEWASRLVQGVGWTPTNVQITCFEVLAESPYGALGDLILVPDAETRFQLPAKGNRPALDFSLGDIGGLEGAPWELCTRSILKRALAELDAVAGLILYGAFEHEFKLTNFAARDGDAYSFRGFRTGQDMAETLIAMMRQAGVRPDTFMKEYGPTQYEVTNAPATGVRIADDAAILRMLTSEAAEMHGLRASFAPILDPTNVGNGVHVHLSFRDKAGAPATWNAKDEHGLSDAARHFIGGILAHLDQIIAILAPSDVSYLRLTPHRWSAAYNNLGYRDREAAVRICPVTGDSDAEMARRFNFEVRACDAAASPHLALAAIIFAGVEGIRGKIEPPAVTQDDVSLWSSERLTKAGLTRLPQNLGSALEVFEASETTSRWFGPEFKSVYCAHKRGEMACLDGMDDNAKCARYGEAY
ncbi:MAG: glutamine synthetase family protein [Paracoccaceae bacterium]